MIALVIGGAGSGKSAYAEKLCLAAAHRIEAAVCASAAEAACGVGGDLAAPTFASTLRTAPATPSVLGTAAGTAPVPPALPPAFAPLYVATMPRDGADAEQRIERHRRLRAGKGFTLLERPLDLAAAPIPPASSALLECLGTLMANELFRSYPVFDAARAESAVLAGVDHLAAAVRDVILVTNDVFADGMAYDEGTMMYLDALAAVNRALAARADAVVEVVCGIPLWHRGSEADWMGDR